MQSRIPTHIGTIAGSITAIAIVSHSPSWLPHFIQWTAHRFAGDSARFYEPALVLIVFVGGGGLLGTLIGRLALLIYRRIHDDNAA